MKDIEISFEKLDERTRKVTTTGDCRSREEKEYWREPILTGFKKGKITLEKEGVLRRMETIEEKLWSSLAEMRRSRKVLDWCPDEKVDMVPTFLGDDWKLVRLLERFNRTQTTKTSQLAMRFRERKAINKLGVDKLSAKDLTFDELFSPSDHRKRMRAVGVEVDGTPEGMQHLPCTRVAPLRPYRKASHRKSSPFMLDTRKSLTGSITFDSEEPVVRVVSGDAEKRCYKSTGKVQPVRVTRVLQRRPLGHSGRRGMSLKDYQAQMLELHQDDPRYYDLLVAVNAKITFGPLSFLVTLGPQEHMFPYITPDDSGQYLVTPAAIPWIPQPRFLSGKTIVLSLYTVPCGDGDSGLLAEVQVAYGLEVVASPVRV